MTVRIRRIETHPLRIPLATPMSSALGRYTHVDCTVVLVHTDDGLTGTGFTASLGGHASVAIAPYIEAELAPLIVGGDASAPESLWSEMWTPNKPRLRGGIGAWALSAVDIALWDVAAKTADVPLVTMLGGSPSPVPVYGSGGWHSLSDGELLDEAASFIELGIAAYKYKTGTERDHERTALLRRELGDGVTLLADANQRFTVDAAVEHATMLADYGVGWLEEPVIANSLTDLAQVARHSPVPIAAGENAYFTWEFRDLFEASAVAYAQPDVGRVGGVTEFRRVADLAAAHGVELSTHLWHELSISLLAAAPAAYRCEYAELLPTGTLTRDFPVVDGAILIPDVAGHGVEFTSDALASHRT